MIPKQIQSPQLYIGLMSGTSLDGIDAALVDFSTSIPNLIATHYSPFDNTIQKQIQSLTKLHYLVEYGQLDHQLGQLFAKVALELLAKTQYQAQDICAIGSHGQTVYHHPNSESAFSLQIGDPNLIAQLTGITTIADFRRRDIAAGGQGAPLVPAFHQAIFANHCQKTTVLNIGGIANITILYQQPLIAFDTGIGNTFMDYWCRLHLQQQYDIQGQWARTGQIIPELLYQFKQDNYFFRSPPKSTGQEYFSVKWLESHLMAFKSYSAQDIQATLCRLTAETIIDAIHHYAPETQQLIVCGGGVHNLFLMEQLQTTKWSAVSSELFGINPNYVEAMAFAWLAKQTLFGLSGNVTSVTGATMPVILGGIYL
jgi:anhydro-N-acetylmuramic acid kinase